MNGIGNLEAARKLLAELKAAYEALPEPYRWAVREALIGKSNAGVPSITPQLAK